jgi:hypothetical protein
MVSDGQLTAGNKVGICIQLCNKFIFACNGKPRWSTKVILATVREFKHHDVLSPGIFTDEFHYNCPPEWIYQSLITLEKAIEAYMVEDIAESHY